MRNFVLVATLMMFPVFSEAQELDSRYTEVGRFIGTLGEVSVDFVGTFDNERERSSVTINERSGFPMISVQTRSIALDGSLTKPGVGVLIGPIMVGSSSKADVTVMSDDGFYVANMDFDGSLPLQALTYDATSLSFSVLGQLVPVKR